MPLYHITLTVEDDVYHHSVWGRDEEEALERVKATQAYSLQTVVDFENTDGPFSEDLSFYRIAAGNWRGVDSWGLDFDVAIEAQT